jgi:hypothetical protein
VRTELNSLEKNVLEHLLRGREPWKIQLSRQIDFVSVIERIDTVVGGYTIFSVKLSAAAATIPPGAAGYPPVTNVNHPDLKFGGAFVLWTESGRLDRLEYYSMGDERWPHGGDNSASQFDFLD